MFPVGRTWSLQSERQLCEGVGQNYGFGIKGPGISTVWPWASNPWASVSSLTECQGRRHQGVLDVCQRPLSQPWHCRYVYFTSFSWSCSSFSQVKGLASTVLIWVLNPRKVGSVCPTYAMTTKIFLKNNFICETPAQTLMTPYCLQGKATIPFLAFELPRLGPTLLIQLHHLPSVEMKSLELETQISILASPLCSSVTLGNFSFLLWVSYAK